MNDTNPYESLSLDEILEITGSDASHAPQLREQGRGLKALADKLDESVEALLAARRVAETGFGGLAASEMHHRATRLVVRGSEGHAVLREQPGVFFGLSEQAELTHQRMRELRDERDRKLEQAPAGDRAAIREDYTRQARQYMRETTWGYVKALRRSDWMKGYHGPRLPRDGEAHGPKGFVDRNTPGPSLGKSGGEFAPQLQGGVTLTPEVGNGGNAGPVVKGQSWNAFGSVAIVSPSNRNSKKKRDRNRSSVTDVGDRVDAPVKRDLVPPVIGGRGEPEMAAVAEPAPPSRPEGVVPPVIGARESSLWMDVREPLHRHDGLLPPVIGGRGVPMFGPGAMSQPGTSAPAAPPEPQPPRRGFSATDAGVRAVRPEHPAEGRVFRGGTGESQPTEPSTEAGYTREPKPVHGGPDSLNRAVIRNSRAFAEPPAAPMPEPAPTPRWRRTPEEPEFETGPFITNYNLGRSQ